MWRDPIVEEVRKTRGEIFARFGNDLGRYIAFLRAKQGDAHAPENGPQTAARKRAAARKSGGGGHKADRKRGRAA